MGSLVLSIPSTYTGGSLLVRQNGSEIHFDWSKSANLEWAFLAPDCDYKVLPITSGHRVTVQYKVYKTVRAPYLDALITSDTRSTVYTSMLLKLREESDDLLKLGFGLRHTYPDAQMDRPAKHLILRGDDRLLWNAARELHLKPKLQVVWAPTFDEESEDESDSPFESWIKRAYQTSNDTAILQHMLIGDDWVENHLRYAGANKDKEILWLPQRFDHLVWYVPNGNDASVMFPAKSGVAIMIDIPAEPTNK